MLTKVSNFSKFADIKQNNLRHLSGIINKKFKKFFIQCTLPPPIPSISYYLSIPKF